MNLAGITRCRLVEYFIASRVRRFSSAARMKREPRGNVSRENVCGKRRRDRLKNIIIARRQNITRHSTARYTHNNNNNIHITRTQTCGNFCSMAYYSSSPIPFSNGRTCVIGLIKRLRSLSPRKFDPKVTLRQTPIENVYRRDTVYIRHMKIAGEKPSRARADAITNEIIYRDRGAPSLRRDKRTGKAGGRAGGSGGVQPGGGY